MRKPSDMLTVCHGPNKQEEIRVWAKKFLEGTAHNGTYDGLEITMLEELQDLGVVIKVERGGLPKLQSRSEWHRKSYEAGQEDMLTIGFVFTKPLIK